MVSNNKRFDHFISRYEMEKSVLLNTQWTIMSCTRTVKERETEVSAMYNTMMRVTSIQFKCCVSSVHRSTRFALSEAISQKNRLLTEKRFYKFFVVFSKFSILSSCFRFCECAFQTPFFHAFSLSMTRKKVCLKHYYGFAVIEQIDCY